MVARIHNYFSATLTVCLFVLRNASNFSFKFQFIIYIFIILWIGHNNNNNINFALNSISLLLKSKKLVVRQEWLSSEAKAKATAAALLFDYTGRSPDASAINKIGPSISAPLLSLFAFWILKEKIDYSIGGRLAANNQLNQSWWLAIASAAGCMYSNDDIVVFTFGQKHWLAWLFLFELLFSNGESKSSRTCCNAFGPNPISHTNTHLRRQKADWPSKWESN